MTMNLWSLGSREIEMVMDTLWKAAITAQLAVTPQRARGNWRGTARSSIVARNHFGFTARLMIFACSPRANPCLFSYGCRYSVYHLEREDGAGVRNQRTHRCVGAPATPY